MVEVSVVVVNQTHKPTLCCQGERAIEKFRKGEEKRCRLCDLVQNMRETDRPTNRGLR